MPTSADDAATQFAVFAGGLRESGVTGELPSIGGWHPFSDSLSYGGLVPMIFHAIENQMAFWPTLQLFIVTFNNVFFSVWVVRRMWRTLAWGFAVSDPDEAVPPVLREEELVGA